MVEETRTHLWAMRALFAALSAGVILWRILPLSTMPAGWAGPDLILALAFAWVLRRPQYVPPLLIVAVVLLTDLVFQRPPGLWTALVLLACETLKARAPGLRDMGFGPEWLTVAVTTLGLALLYRLTLAVLLVPQAPWGLSLMQMAMTVLFYPLVVMVSSLILGVRKTKPEISGRRGRI